MKSTVSVFVMAAFCLQLGSSPAIAKMNNEEKALAALAILGISILAHHKHHYKDGYEPVDGVETAEFERGYRDGLHGYAYWEHSQTRGYVEGYQAGETERENSVAHRRIQADQKAPR